MKKAATPRPGTSWFHWLDEGGEIQPGLNVYRPSDKYSVGGVLALGKHRWRCRWSKVRSRFFVGHWTWSA